MSRVSQVSKDVPENKLPKSVQQDDGTWVGKGGEGHKFRNGPDAGPKPGDTVVVVGAGPSGIHMAHILKKRGVNPIILEAGNRVGGKVCTVVHDNVPHEMGACYITPEYWVLKDLLKEYGIINDIVKLPDRDIYLEDTSKHPEEIIDGLGVWAKRTVKEHFVDQKAPLASSLPDGAFGPHFILHLKRFQVAHRRVMGGSTGTYHGMMPPRPSPEAMKELTQPFDQFLRDNKCQAIEKMMLIAVTSQGYGRLDQVPTYLALTWFTAEFAEAFLQTILNPKSAEPVITLFRGGHLKLFQKMVEKDQLDVRLMHEVRKIERGPGGVKVSGVRPGAGCAGGSSTFTVAGTHVFVACPFVPIAKAFSLTPQEKRVISDLRPNTFCTHLVERAPRGTGNPNNAVSSWPDRLVPSSRMWNLANMYAERWSWRAVGTKPELAVANPRNVFEQYSDNASKPWDPAQICISADAEVAADKPTEGKQVVVCNQFVEEGQSRLPDGSIDVAFLRKRLDEELKLQGVSDYRVIKSFPWDYFWHNSAEGIKDGLPWDILEMQGDNRTFWIGGSACFESINDVTNYNRELMHHFLPPQ